MSRDARSRGIPLTGSRIWAGCGSQFLNKLLCQAPQPCKAGGNATRLDPLPRLVQLPNDVIGCTALATRKHIAEYDALPSQVSEARAPQSRISRWQFPLDYAFNSGIWRTIGTTANSPDPDELAVVRFLAVRDVWQTSAWGNHQRTVDDYIL